MTADRLTKVWHIATLAVLLIPIIAIILEFLEFKRKGK